MKNNDDKRNIFNSRWFYRIIALVFAICLFIYVNGSKLEKTHQSSQSVQNTSLTSTKTKTVTMPLDLTVNSDKYVVTGYPETVKVKISGPAALVTTTTNTQNFKVYADLSSLGAGTHRVKILESGINNDLTHTIRPKAINVTIQTRKTETIPVEVKVNQNQLADGYKVGKATASTDSVQITGAVSEIEKVDHVEATVNLSKKNKSDVSKSVTLQAVDKNGNTVNVVITPSSTTVKVPIGKQSDSSSNSSSDNNSSSGSSSKSSGSSSNNSSSSSSASSSSNSSSSSSQK